MTDGDAAPSAPAASGRVYHHRSSRPGEALARTDAEIAAEKAGALGRAGERLEQALRDVAEIAARARALGPPTAAGALAAEYEGARARAREARLALVIQREAVGLRQHRVVEQLFPEPPPFHRLGLPCR
jgi:hypothetical protein